jgi:hypothetical protein
VNELKSYMANKQVAQKAVVTKRQLLAKQVTLDRLLTAVTRAQLVQGFTNWSNNCWANAPMVALAFATPLRVSLLRSPHLGTGAAVAYDS